MSRISHDEDEYDFEYIFCTSNRQYNQSRTFTLDEYGNPIRPQNRARVPQDNVVKLPPVLVGQTRNQARHGVDINAMAKDRRVRQTTATTREPNWGESLQRERDKLRERRYQQYEYSASPSPHPYYERKPVGVVQTGTISAHDRKLTDCRLPPTFERHRIADNVNQEAYHPSYVTEEFHKTRAAASVYIPDNHQYTGGDRLTAHRDNVRYDEDLLYYTPAPPTVPNYSKSYNTSDHVPAPPTSKPSDSHSYNKNRRQLKYRNQELDKDATVYKPVEPQTADVYASRPSSNVSAFVDDLDQKIEEALAMESKFATLNEEVKLLISQYDGLGKLDQDVPIYKPQQSYINNPASRVSECVDDFDQDLKEAVEMESKFAALNDKVNLLKSEGGGLATGAGRRLGGDDVDKFLEELDDILENPMSPRPNSVAAANRNLDGCTTPLHMPAAAVVPHMSKEPLKQWNGQTAKLGVGFKSKLKKVEPKVRHAGNDVIPDRVRQKMNQYLN